MGAGSRKSLIDFPKIGYVTTPRHQLVDFNNPLFYHLVSRCVRRSWLCGRDVRTRRDYSHRKSWFTERLKQLGGAFAIDVYAYAIMSNHFHLVVYYDPSAPSRWTDDEVADRWLRVCPPKTPDGDIDEGMLELRKSELLSDQELLAKTRAKLGSLSQFMKFLKQPIARRANREDNCLGHFFDQRFYSGALLSEAAVLAAMAYVDLNPVRAQIAQTIEDAKHTAIHARLAKMDGPAELAAYLEPVISGLDEEPLIQITLGDYVEHLRVLCKGARPHWAPAKLSKWRNQVATLKKRQRVFGPRRLIARWATDRGWQLRESPLPE